MKWTKLLLLPIFAVMACSQPANDKSPQKEESQPKELPVVEPQQNGGGEKVKEALNVLLDLAKNGNCKGMDGKLARREKSGPWTHALSYAKADDQLQIEKMCAKMQVLVTDLDHVEYSEFIQETESEGEWNVWEVMLHYQDGSAEKTAFAFLKGDEGFILGDID